MAVILSFGLIHLRKVVLIILLCLTKNLLFSQNIEYNFIDKKTYDYYMSKQCDSLIYLGNIALQNNIDYFYLRSRIGAAYFEKKNYIKASEHFEKALIFNGSDNFALENLYYCYIYLGRENDANYLLNKYSQVFSDKIKFKFLSELNFEFGGNYNKANYNNTLNEIKDSIQWAESNIINNILYIGGAIKYNVSKNIIITNAYSNIKIENKKQIVIGNEILNDNYNVYQKQIYANINYRISKGTIIIPAFHFIIVNYNTLFSNFDSAKNKVILERKAMALNDFAASLAIDKKMSKFGFNVFGSFSRLNNNDQKQIGLSVNIYPLGNLNLYTLTTFVFQNTSFKNNFIAEQNIGFKTFKFLWIEGFATFGNLENYVEKNAYVVYNINEIINFRTGISAIIPFQKIQFTLRYNYLQKTVPFEIYDNNPKKESFKQTQHLLIGTLSYKF